MDLQIKMTYQEAATFLSRLIYTVQEVVGEVSTDEDITAKELASKLSQEITDTALGMMDIPDVKEVLREQILG